MIPPLDSADRLPPDWKHPKNKTRIVFGFHGHKVLGTPVKGAMYKGGCEQINRRDMR